MNHKCPNCGVEVAEHVKFCPNCGTAQKNARKISPKRAVKEEKKKNTLRLSDQNTLYLVAILSLLIAAFYGYRYVKPLPKIDPHDRIPVADQVSQFDQKHYQHLQENLKANPNGFKENVDLANFLFDNQRYQDALIYYVQALHADPNQPDVLVDAGVCYFNLKKLEEARGYFEKALKIDNRHLNALYNMGIVSAQQGNMSQMIEYWEQLIKIAPESAQAKSAKQMLDGVRAVKP